MTHKGGCVTPEGRRGWDQRQNRRTFCTPMNSASMPRVGSGERCWPPSGSCRDRSCKLLTLQGESQHPQPTRAAAAMGTQYLLLYRNDGEKHFSSICAPTWMLGDQIPSKTHSLACRRSWRRAGFASGLDPANFILKRGKKPFALSSHVVPSCVPPATATDTAGTGQPARLSVPRGPSHQTCRFPDWGGLRCQSRAGSRTQAGRGRQQEALGCPCLLRRCFSPWGDGPAARKNVDVSHLQDLRSREVCVQSFSGSSCLKSKSSESAPAITDATFAPQLSERELRTLQDAAPSRKA